MEKRKIAICDFKSSCRTRYDFEYDFWNQVVDQVGLSEGKVAQRLEVPREPRLSQVPLVGGLRNLPNPIWTQTEQPGCSIWVQSGSELNPD